MLVARDEDVRSAACAILHVLEQFLAVLGRPLAGHEAQEEATLRLEGGMVPVVSANPVERVVGVAVRLLLPDEAPLLIELTSFLCNLSLGHRTP